MFPLNDFPLNDFPLSDFPINDDLNRPDRRKLLGVRSGKYGGCVVDTESRGPL